MLRSALTEVKQRLPIIYQQRPEQRNKNVEVKKIRHSHYVVPTQEFTSDLGSGRSKDNISPRSKDSSNSSKNSGGKASASKSSQLSRQGCMVDGVMVYKAVKKINRVKHRKLLSPIPVVPGHLPPMKKLPKPSLALEGPFEGYGSPKKQQQITPPDQYPAEAVKQGNNNELSHEEDSSRNRRMSRMIDDDLEPISAYQNPYMLYKSQQSLQQSEPSKRREEELDVQYNPQYNKSIKPFKTKAKANTNELHELHEVPLQPLSGKLASRRNVNPTQMNIPYGLAVDVEEVKQI